MDDQPTGNRRHDGPEQYLKLYETRYGNFASPVYAEIRRETFGKDIGQSGWLTADELTRFIGRLELTLESDVVDVASGAGGPARTLHGGNRGVSGDRCGY